MKPKKKLGEIFLEAGKISPAQLRDALEDQKRYGGKLGTILLERRFISEKDFFAALTRQMQIPAIDFTRSTIPEAVIKLVPQEMAEKQAVFPVALKNTPQGRVLVVAMSDPTNVEIQDEIRFATSYKVEPALALEATIRYAIREYYFQQGGKGSYRMQPDFSPAAGRQAAEENEMPLINHAMERTISDAEYLGGPAQSSENGPPPQPGEDKPQLTRELKALLKLLAKKGILSSKEYLDIFKETK